MVISIAKGKKQKEYIMAKYLSSGWVVVWPVQLDERQALAAGWKKVELEASWLTLLQSLT